jgi:hypothetical protein
MIGGLHAETMVFATMAQTSQLALTSGWPWFGRASRPGAGEVTLQGSEPRSFRVAVTGARRRSAAVQCQMDLYDLDGRFSAILRTDITFVRDVSRTRLTLSGSVAVDIAAASPTQRLDARRLGSEYVRALVSEIAQSIERRCAGTASGTSHAAASQP